MCGGERKITKSEYRVLGVQTEFRTGNFPNTSEKHYRWNQADQFKSLITDIYTSGCVEYKLGILVYWWRYDTGDIGVKL
jgi:hypothetical protein